MWITETFSFRADKQDLHLDNVHDPFIAHPEMTAEYGDEVAGLDVIDRKIDVRRRERAVLEEFLHRSMTGEARAADFDL